MNETLHLIHCSSFYPVLHQVLRLRPADRQEHAGQRDHGQNDREDGAARHGKVADIGLRQKDQPKGRDDRCSGRPHGHPHKQRHKAHGNKNRGFQQQLQVESGAPHVKINGKGRDHKAGARQNTAADQQPCQNQRRKVEDPDCQHLGYQNFLPPDGIGKHQIHGFIFVCTHDKRGQHHTRKDQGRHTGEQFDRRRNRPVAGSRIRHAGVRIIGNSQIGQRGQKQAEQHRQDDRFFDIFSNIIFLPFQFDQFPHPITPPLSFSGNSLPASPPSFQAQSPQRRSESVSETVPAPAPGCHRCGSARPL